MRRDMRGQWRVDVLAGIAVLAVVLAGCGASSGASSSPSSGSASNSSASSTTTVSVKVGVPGTYATMIGLYLAQAKGYFAKQHLNVQVIPFKGDAPAVKALVGSAVDINVASLAGMLQGVQQGAPLTAFYAGFDQSTALDWYGTKPINWSHVAGTKWGVSSPGSSTALLTRYLLVKHHVNLNSVTLVPTGGGAGDLSALKSHEVNYDLMAPELGVIAAKETGVKIEARQSSLMSEYPFHVVYARTAWLNSHQDIAVRFLRGLVQGMKLSLSDTAAGIQEQSTILKEPLSIAKETYSTNVNSDVHPDGAMPNAQSMNEFWQMAIQGGLFKKRLPQSQWLDTKWIDTYPSWMK